MLWKSIIKLWKKVLILWKSVLINVSESCDYTSLKYVEVLWSLPALYHEPAQMSRPPEYPQTPTESRKSIITLHKYLTENAQHLTILTVTNGAKLCQLLISQHRSSVIESLWNLMFSVTSTRIRLTGKSYSNWNPQKSVNHMWRIWVTQSVGELLILGSSKVLQ